MIKAIETHWKGYLFRSRLEARWAVFFESIKAEWKYEPQGFEKEGYEGRRLRYLPDFQIKIGKHEYWVEVKGDKNWLHKNFREIEELHDWGGVLPGFCSNGEEKGVPNGLILLGDIPEPRFGVLFVPVLGHRKGLNLYWRALDPHDGLRDLNQLALFHLGLDDTEVFLSGGGENCKDFESKIVSTPRAYPPVYYALMNARSARFEHGEQPRTGVAP